MTATGVRWPLAAALLAAAALAPQPVWAGGYNLMPRGARSLGRGGAFVASADDLTAAWLNPARLAVLRGVQVLGDLGMVAWDVDFQRAADPSVAPDGFGRAENMAPPVWSPSLFLGWDFGLDWFEATLGFYGPYAGDLGFDSIGPQRYSLVYLDMFYAIYQVAVAVRPVRWLAIGAAFQIQDIRMTEAVKLSAYTGFTALGGPEDPSNDILVELDVASHTNPSGQFGVWAGPADWVDLGLSVQLPVSVEAGGTVRAWLPSDNPMLREARVDGDRVTVRLANAMWIRAGVGFRLPYRFQLEVDAWAEVWEPHSEIYTQVHDVVLRDVEGGMDIEFSDIVVPQDWRTSFGAAAGVEWEALERRLHLRLGLFYDSNAIPDQTLSVAWYDAHKIGLCLGLSVEFWRMAIDVGYTHIFYVPRTVDDSVVTQINPLEPQSEAIPSVVGNGDYESSANAVGLTVRAQFDTPRWGRRRSERETTEPATDTAAPASP